MSVTHGINSNALTLFPFAKKKILSSATTTLRLDATRFSQAIGVAYLEVTEPTVTVSFVRTSIVFAVKI